MACRLIKDDHGTLYRIPQAKHVKTPGAQQLPGYPHVDVWWDRDVGRKRNNESLIIRQDNNATGVAGEKADVIELTMGQVYDLIHALSWAIMRP